MGINFRGIAAFRGYINVHGTMLIISENYTFEIYTLYGIYFAGEPL